MKRWLVGAVIITLCMGALGYILGERVLSSREPQTAQQLSAGEALTVIPVGRGDIARFVTASGNLQPNRTVDLRFNSSGRVEEIFVEVGGRVARGDALARLDNRQQELAYFRAQNDLEIARLDAAPNVVREREIDRELAWEALEQTILRAPFDGLVTAVNVEPGEVVGTNDLVIQVIDDSAYLVQVAIDELDISQVRPGQLATVTLDADRDRPRTGKVHQVAMTANVQSGMVTVPVTVRLDAVDELLRPGYTATVRIAVADATGVVRVPVEAVSEQGGAFVVTKVVDGERSLVPVETGMTDGVWIEIRAGLEPGDRIVGLNYRAGAGGFSGMNSGQAMRGLTGGARPVVPPGAFR